MDINLKVKKNLQIRAFYLFFIISSIQLGVGIMGLPRIVYLEALQDSWISILIASVYIFIELIIMLIILKQYNNADIYGIQVDIFGNWAGKLLGSIYIVHFAFSFFSVLITYLEIVRIYIFPTLNNLMLGTLVLMLVVYGLLGGIRVIVGVCTLFFIFTHWLLLLLVQPAIQVDITHFQPMFVASITDILNGAKSTSYTLMGFEILFLIYPFIINKKKAKFSIMMGAGWTSFLTLALTVLVFGYYSLDQIQRREWALLGLFKIQNLTFIERFDYIVVASWMMVIIPNLLLLMWGITYGMKRLYRIPQKVTLYVSAFIFLIACFFFDEHNRITMLIDFTSNYGFWLVYVYPFVLLPIVLMKKRRKKKVDKYAK